METTVFAYQGAKISFRGGDSVMINATEMAKPFGKRPAKWLELTSTQDFINTLTAIRNSDTAMVHANSGGDGGGGGTWMHEDVALEFARWLSPAFAIWCNDRIKELLTQGVSTIANDDEAILHAMEVLRKRVEAGKRELQAAQKTIERLEPKARLMDRVLDSDQKIDIGQAAKILGLPFGRNTLFSELRKRGVFFANRNEPKQEYIKRGCFYLKETWIERNNHDGFVVIKVLVTQKGLDLLSKLFDVPPNDKKCSKIL